VEWLPADAPADTVLPDGEVRVACDEQFVVDLDEVDFAPIIALAEPLLAEARRLAEWSDDGPLNHAGRDMLFRVVQRWLTLESALAANDMEGSDARWRFPASMHEEDDPRVLAAICLHGLAGDVRNHADWFKNLTEEPDACRLDLAPDANMGMPHAAFAKRLAVAVELLRQIDAADKSQRQRMSVEEADRKARDLTNTAKKKKAFFDLSETIQAEQRIGCSWGTWSKTHYFQEAVECGWLAKRKNAKNKTGGSPPAVVSLTSALEAAVGEGRQEEVLHNLAEEEGACAAANRDWTDLPKDERQAILAEHEAENASNPSPLEPRPRKVHNRKSL
jgi:hypothetical protein